MSYEYSSSEAANTDEDEIDDYTTSSGEVDSSDDEDEEIDVENGEIDKTWASKTYASISGVVKRFEKTKKTHHNALERKRRIEIADTYDCLKETLDVDLSRAQLLKYAAEKIVEDSELNRVQDLQLADLKRQHEALLREVENVKRAKTVENYKQSGK